MSYLSTLNLVHIVGVGFEVLLLHEITLVCRDEPTEDDGIKTITYDEYVNAVIPDALLQGLGFAESLSKEPENAEDENDVGENPAEQTVIPDAGISSTDVQPEPSTVMSAPVIPAASLIALISSQVAAAVVSGNSTATLRPPMTSSTTRNNIISSTPPALSLVDRRGNILPTLPSVPGLVGNACSSSLIAPGAPVRYIDQNGRVLTSVPVPSSATDAPQVVRMVDSNGRIVTNQTMPNTRMVDKDGRIISTGVSSLENTTGISKTVASADVEDFHVSSSTSAGSLKRKESSIHRSDTQERSIPQSW